MPKAAHVYPVVNVTLVVMVCMSGQGSQTPVGTVLTLRVNIRFGLVCNQLLPLPPSLLYPFLPCLQQ